LTRLHDETLLTQTNIVLVHREISLDLGNFLALASLYFCHKLCSFFPLLKFCLFAGIFNDLFAFPDKLKGLVLELPLSELAGLLVRMQLVIVHFAD